ncbi:hypothetical protein JXB12_10500 [candidate division KSB1 bacterium]|nr:hypothetical protein [candidate division KSB1 bacterium]
MKKLTVLLVAAALTLSLGANLNAANKNQDWLLDRAEENYLLLCKKGCCSVTESVILNIIIMKTKYPEFNYSKINKALDKLVACHESAVVRHKAYIASMYLRHPELFNLFDEVDLQYQKKYFKDIAENPNAFFKTMALNLENNLLLEY